jgi:hypothetical protein
MPPKREPDRAGSQFRTARKQMSGSTRRICASTLNGCVAKLHPGESLQLSGSLPRTESREGMTQAQDVT